MKITKNSPNLVATAEAAKANKASTEGAREKKGVSGKDALGSSTQVDLSERAQQMKKAKDIASQDTVDEAKVARLQALIDQGKYKVDAQAVADRLVDEHLSTS